jgi:hypothetical protein
MTVRLWIKATMLWLVILALAIGNGTAREAVLVPWFGPAAGLLASGATLSLVILLVALVSARWLGAQQRQAWLVGALWLVLTLLFEFSFGAFVQHKSWSELMDAYTFRGGNVWPLVLLVTLVAPPLASRRRVARRR